MIDAYDYAARPIIDIARKKVVRIKEEYDEILGMNIKIKFKGAADSLDPEKLDEAFIDIIIADYVESTKYKLKIQIVTDDPPDEPERADSPTLGTA